MSSYKEARKIVTDLEKKAKELEEVSATFARLHREVQMLAQKAYAATPKTDALYGDSLLSPARITGHLRNHLMVLGEKWAARDYVGVENIKPFSKEISLACGWLLKFEKDEVAQTLPKGKTGPHTQVEDLL